MMGGVKEGVWREDRGIRDEEEDRIEGNEKPANEERKDTVFALRFDERERERERVSIP